MKKPINIIIQFNINFNSFMENYEKNYFKKICLDSIRRKLDIPKSDNLKKNGTFKRGLYYTVENDLRYTRIKIQTLLWKTASGKRIYISVFPSFIVKYNKVFTNLIEFISNNVGKEESVFNYIKDSGTLLECEDILIKSCERVNKVVTEKKFTSLLNAKYTETFNSPITAINFVHYREINLKFKGIFFLVTVAKICAEAMILKDGTLSYLNEFFKFLR